MYLPSACIGNSNDSTDTAPPGQMAFSAVSIFVTVMSMVTEKRILDGESGAIVSFDVTGNRYVNSICSTGNIVANYVTCCSLQCDVAIVHLQEKGIYSSLIMHHLCEYMQIASVSILSVW